MHGIFTHIWLWLIFMVNVGTNPIYTWIVWGLMIEQFESPQPPSLQRVSSPV